MEQLKQALNWAIGLELESKDINVLQMSLRAAIIFIISIVLLRIGNKRFMGKSTAMDVMLGIVFGSTVSRAITGNAPFFPTLAASLVLVLLHWLLAAVAFRSHGFGQMVKGRDSVLVRDGEPQRDAMRRSHITEQDIEEAMRNQGKQPEIRAIKAAHLERNGDISIITKDS
ncbi:MAG TPA: YetF domain-containing protein [Pyrinomonadaceae bacterium]|nr:YetF domain-containing protein [Pyrinomonadaceae bacterium]